MSCSISILSSEHIQRHKDRLYQLYVTTYSAAGESLWFKQADDLVRYPCGIITNCQADQTNTDGVGDNIRAFFMFQFRPSANKISLICHDGTVEGKHILMNMIDFRLSTKGWIIEASGATSWVLRKRNVPIIRDVHEITKLLMLPLNERVVINDYFNLSDKNSQHYIHEYTNGDGLVLFSNQETLFGSGSCEFVGEYCARACLTGGRLHTGVPHQANKQKSIETRKTEKEKGKKKVTATKSKGSQLVSK